jgi:predicted signal transduction protein with EAL and GGDEF domain
VLRRPTAHSAIAGLPIARAPSYATGLEELHPAADSALYAAEGGGRDRVAVAAG